MITVIFSTYNGGERLQRTLDSMSRARSPKGGWRLIAVDNRSTDATPQVLRSFEGRLPIEILHEPKPGKNHALNRAIEHALPGNPDIFVFCDDDVLVEENWLEAWRAVVDAHPEFDAFAGLTKPAWPVEPPEWLLRHPHLGSLMSIHRGVQEGPCNPRLMHGTNMALRASLFHEGIRYNGNIGPDGTPTYAMGSETELAIRLDELGRKCWFAMEPAVGHIIRPEQLTHEWTIRRAYRLGRGMAAMDSHGQPKLPLRVRLKNMAKAALYPLILPLLAENKAAKRRWYQEMDRGFEDGIRTLRGLKPRWLKPS